MNNNQILKHPYDSTLTIEEFKQALRRDDILQMALYVLEPFNIYTLEHRQRFVINEPITTNADLINVCNKYKDAKPYNYRYLANWFFIDPFEPVASKEKYINDMQSKVLPKLYLYDIGTGAEQTIKISKPLQCLFNLNDETPQQFFDAYFKSRYDEFLTSGFINDVQLIFNSIKEPQQRLCTDEELKQNGYTFMFDDLEECQQTLKEHQSKTPQQFFDDELSFLMNEEPNLFINEEIEEFKKQEPQQVYNNELELLQNNYNGSLQRLNDLRASKKIVVADNNKQLFDVLLYNIDTMIYLNVTSYYDLLKNQKEQYINIINDLKDKIKTLQPPVEPVEPKQQEERQRQLYEQYTSYNYFNNNKLNDYVSQADAELIQASATRFNQSLTNDDLYCIYEHQINLYNDFIKGCDKKMQNCNITNTTENYINNKISDLLSNNIILKKQLETIKGDFRMSMPQMYTYQASQIFGMLARDSSFTNKQNVGTKIDDIPIKYNNGIEKISIHYNVGVDVGSVEPITDFDKMVHNAVCTLIYEYEKNNGLISNENKFFFNEKQIFKTLQASNKDDTTIFIDEITKTLHKCSRFMILIDNVHLIEKYYPNAKKSIYDIAMPFIPVHQAIGTIYGNTTTGFAIWEYPPFYQYGNYTKTNKQYQNYLISLGNTNNSIDTIKIKRYIVEHLQANKDKHYLQLTFETIFERCKINNIKPTDEELNQIQLIADEKQRDEELKKLNRKCKERERRHVKTITIFMEALQRANEIKQFSLYVDIVKTKDKKGREIQQPQQPKGTKGTKQAVGIWIEKHTQK